MPRVVQMTRSECTQDLSPAHTEAAKPLQLLLSLPRWLLGRVYYTIGGNIPVLLKIANRTSSLLSTWSTFKWTGPWHSLFLTKSHLSMWPGWEQTWPRHYVIVCHLDLQNGFQPNLLKHIHRPKMLQHLSVYSKYINKASLVLRIIWGISINYNNGQKLTSGILSTLTSLCLWSYCLIFYSANIPFLAS